MDRKVYIINDKWKLDVYAHSILCDGRRLNVTENQYKLLEVLITNNHRSLSFAQLCDYSVEEVNDERQCLRDLLTAIKKIDEELRELVKSDRNYGYHFDADVKLLKENKEEIIEVVQTPKGFSFDNKSDLRDLNIINRECELDQIFNQLSVSKVVFIGGVDGIGKTTIVKQYAYQNLSEYKNVFYIVCNKPIVNIIADDMLIPNMGLSRKVTKENVLEDDESYCIRKLSKMKEIVSEKTLIILDDYQAELGELEYLLSLNAKFLIVTHRDLYGIENALIVESLKTKELQCDLFFRNYQRKDICKKEPYLQELFDLVGGHTLSIILIAKQLMVSRMYPKELYMKIDKEGLRNALTEEVRMNSMSKSRKAFAYINELFKVSELSDKELNVLQLLCIMSPSEVQSRDLVKWIGDKGVFQTVDNLNALGWIELNNDTDTISVFPIIKEAVLAYQEIDLNKYGDFFGNFLKEYSDFDLFALPINLKHNYCRISKEIMKSGLEINESTYSFFLKSVRLLSMFYPDESIRLADKMLKYVETMQNRVFDIGYLHYCNGWTKSKKLNVQAEGLKDYNKAIQYIESGDLTTAQKELLPNIFADYGITLCRAGQGEKAIGYIEYAIAALKKEESKANMMKICWYKAFLAESYLMIKDYDKTKQMLDDAYKMHEMYNGEKDIYLSNLLYRDGMLQYELSDYESAKKAAMEAFIIYSDYYPEKSTSNVKHLCFIGCILSKNGEYEESKEYFDKAETIAEETYEDSKEIVAALKREYGVDE